MAIDLNQAEEQREARGAIPPKSKVLVKLNIRPAKEGFEGSAPGLTTARSGMEYLSCELEVLAGQFKGQKIWNNYNVQNASTDGQRKAIEISMRSIRAMVEASRNINPKDASPTAKQARLLNEWTDLDGIYFPVVVGCEVSTPNAQGTRYVNNTIEKIVTPDQDDYAMLMEGGEVITDNPLPKIPEAGESAPPSPAWGKAPQPATVPQQANKWATPQQPAGNTMPKWGQRPGGNGNGAAHQVDGAPF